MVPLLPLLASALWGAGCGREPAGDGGARWLEAEEDLRIAGDTTGYGLSTRPFDLEVDRDGDVFLSQWGKPFVTVFDDRGRVVRVLGLAPGGGSQSGELVSPGRMGWRDSLLWIVDRRASRVTFWNRSGDRVRSVTVRLPGGPTRGLFLPAGVFPDRTLLMSSTASPVQVLPLDELDGTLLRVTADEMVLDTVLVGSGAPARALVRLPNGTRVVAPHPLPTTDLLRQRPDGSELVMVVRGPDREPGGYRVLRIGPDGDTLASARIEAAPRALSPEERQLYARRFARPFAERQGIPLEEAVRASVEQVEFPETVPPVDGLVAGYDGSVWVRRTPRLGTDTMATWEILDDALRPVARVRLPLEVSLLRVRNGEAWGWRPGSQELPYLIRYRIGS